MAPQSAVSPESFDEILAWLADDRETAGTMYVQLRHDLTKIFVWNRCFDPEGLTDEVIDRVAKKVHQLRQTYEGDPRLFFYGVARNLIKEYFKAVKARVSLDDADLQTNPSSQMEDATAAKREECLQLCLRRLTDQERDLIVTYYSKEKRAKIEHRMEMARQLGTSTQNLRVRVYRLRAALERCIESCLTRADD